MTEAELLALAKKVNDLKPPARLRLGASLLELGHGETALPIIRRVADELQLAIMLREIDA